MAELSSDLQASIDALGTQHTNLVQAVRDYNGGSVASATNDLLNTANGIISSIDAKESSLLGLIDYKTGSRAPTLLTDFVSGVYMTKEGGSLKGMGFHDLISCTRPSPTWGFNSSANLVEVPPNEPLFDYDPTTGEALGLYRSWGCTNQCVNSDHGDGDPFSDITSGWDGPVQTINGIGMRSFTRTGPLFRDFDKGSMNGFFFATFVKAESNSQYCRIRMELYYDNGENNKTLYITFDFNSNQITGAVGNEEYFNYGAVKVGNNGLYRLWITGEIANRTKSRCVIYNDGTNPCLFGGITVVDKPYYTNHIPTLSSPVTREDDDYSIFLGDKNVVNPAGMTLAVTINPQSYYRNGFFIQLWANDYLEGDRSVWGAYINDGSRTYHNGEARLAVALAGGEPSIARAYSYETEELFTAAESDGENYDYVSELKIGHRGATFYSGSGFGPFSGHIKNVTLFSYRMTQDELDKEVSP